MSVTTTLARLRELALALPRPGCEWERRPTFDPPATPQSVADFEHLAGFAFPADFRAFFAETNAVVGMSIHNGYYLGDAKGPARSLHRKDFPSIVKGERVAPVATDGGGNAFLLSAIGHVWRWDHETDKVEMIAESFESFLEKVADDWAAYVSDKPGWRFLV
jgi:SMI1 / KNR4 family (SUKH-1)